ncbi:MAG: amino acid adenylation domain-containing protein [Acidobacteriota bacterium]
MPTGDGSARLLEAAERAASLWEVLELRGREQGAERLYTFLGDASKDAAQTLTCGQLWRRAEALARRLVAAVDGERGTRALMLYPPGLDFVIAFFACLRAGVVAVPAYPPGSRRTLPRLRSIAGDCEPHLALTTSHHLEKFETLTGRLPELAAVRWMATDPVEEARGEGGVAESGEPGELGELETPLPQAHELAFLQYTSGSTASPKGVRVAHGNLVANQRMITAAFGHREPCAVVGWLPVYHDMGLIGNVLNPLFAGAPCTLMAPISFLRRPLRWLQAIDETARLTGLPVTSGGPNFAYDLCRRRISVEERESLDLSRWRVAFNGAEPVRASTLRGFAEDFSAAGFSAGAFYPCYGLAEATLFVTGPPPGQGGRVVSVDEGALEVDRFRLRESSAGAGLEAVGCGTPRGGCGVQIVDPESRRPLEAGAIGEVWVSGDAVADGYWRRPEATAEDFGAELAASTEEDDSGRLGESSPQPRWLRTGDLGVVQGGELFVTGRRKDLIILRGRNLYPQDVELSAEASEPALVPGGSAAFAVEGEQGEALVLVAEVERRVRLDASAAAEAVRRGLGERHEVAVEEVVLTRAGAVPRTSSGKVQRRACRELWQNGELPVLGRAAFPRDGGATEELAETLSADGATWAQLPEEERGPWLRGVLRSRVAAAARLPVSKLRDDEALVGLGLDSLAAVEWVHGLERDLGVALGLEEALGGATLEDLAQLLEERLAEAAERASDGAAGSAKGSGAMVSAALVPEGAEGALSQGQRALYFLSRLAPDSAAYHIAVAAEVESATGSLDGDRLRRALELLAQRHGALRTTFAEGEGTQAAGEPRRIVHPSLPPEVHGVRWEDPATLPQQLRRWACEPFDLARGPLLRAWWVELGPGAEEARTEETSAAQSAPVLLLVVHHLVADFWSLARMMRELGALYGSIDSTASAALPDPPAQSYDGHVAAEARRLASAEGERLEAWWTQHLRNITPALDLPTDRPRSSKAEFRGGTVSAEMPDGEALEALARRHGATPFAAWLALFGAALGRWAGVDQRGGDGRLLVAAPTDGRPGPDFEGVVGYFVNPVALVVDVQDDPTLDELLRRVRRESLEVFAHRHFPYPAAARLVSAGQRSSRGALAQVQLAYQRAPKARDRGLDAFALGVAGGHLRLGPLSLSSLPLDLGTTQVDLTLSVARLDGGTGGRTVARLEYDRDLFDRSTAQRWLETIQRLSSLAREDAGYGDGAATSLSRWPWLSAAQRAQLLVQWNDRPLPRPLPPEVLEARTLHELFFATARRQPDRVAVESEDGESLTYGALARRVEELAGRLLPRLSGREPVVAVSLSRSPDAVVALLAALAAGAADLPLDPSLPAARRQQLVRNGRPQVFVGEAVGEDEPVLAVEAAEPGPETTAVPTALSTALPPVDPRRLAYLLYTSGSTGEPKGVAVSHLAVVAHLRRSAASLLRPEDRTLVFGPLASDPSVEQLFGAFLRGATAVLRGPKLWAPEQLSERCRTLGITVADLPTAYVHAVLAETAADEASGGEELGDFGGLRALFASGEALDLEAARALAAAPMEAWNLYGPTESVITATGQRLDAETLAESAPVALGRPLPTRRAYVVDDQGRLLPPGVAGELWVGGPAAEDGCLARGYWRRPSATAEVFVPDPFGDLQEVGGGGRLYRTGDLVRQLADGRLLFLGRVDRQLKILGHRVEPGEVEEVLRRHPRVVEAVVAPDPGPAPGPDCDGSRGKVERLVAWVEPRLEEGEEWSEPRAASLAGDLGDHLRASLPPSLRPSAFALPRLLPRGAAGKVDRRALLRAAQSTPPRWHRPYDVGDGSFTAWSPEGLGKTLAPLWAEVVGAPPAGPGEDFFRAGGDSLGALRLSSRLREALRGKAAAEALEELSPALLFEMPSFGALQGYLEQRVTADSGGPSQSLLELSEAATEGPSAGPSIGSAPRPQAPPLASFAQRRLWFLEQLDEGGGLYHLPGALELEGPLKAESLRRALEHVVRRHDALRTGFYGEREASLDNASLDNASLDNASLGNASFDKASPSGDSAVESSEADQGPRVEVVPADEVSFSLPRVDLAALPSAAAAQAMASLTARVAFDPFDLRRPPLLRALLLRRGAGSHRLLLTVHHLVADGGSLQILMRELGHCLAAPEVAASELPDQQVAVPGLDPLSLTYSDFARWQQRRAAAGDLDDSLDWWRQLLADSPPLLDLPLDRPRGAVRSLRGGLATLPLEPAALQGLAALAADRGVSLFATLLALLQVLLRRFTGRGDGAVGLPSSEREHRSLETLVGLFVNTWVLPGRVESEGLALADLLDQIQGDLLAARRHGAVPFERLVAALAPARQRSATPLYQVMITHQHQPQRQLPWGDVEVRPLRPQQALAGAAPPAPTDWLFEVVSGAEPEGTLYYAADLYDGTTAHRVARAFSRLVAQVGSLGAAAAELPVAQLSVLSAAQRAQLRQEWSGAGLAPWGGAGRLQDPLFRRAQENPAALAVDALDGTLSRGELASAAKALAAELNRRGVGPGQRVGVLSKRRREMLVALVAVLESGAAYVPLDPAYPAERLAGMLEDASMVLAGADAAERVPPSFGGEIVAIPELERLVAAGQDLPRGPGGAGDEALAYVLYTSGSTGRPKGVAIPHRSAAELVAWGRRTYAPSQLRRVLAATSICFDLSVFEIFVSLAAGGVVVLAENALELISRGHRFSDLSLINTVPSAAAEVLRAGALPAPVEVINLAGEALPGELVAGLLAAPSALPPGAQRRVYNLYGPSEDTTYSTGVAWSRWPSEGPSKGPSEEVVEARPGIGRPLPGTQAYVLDSRRLPVPPGVAGELWLGGAGLGRGYLGRPALTALSFQPDPFPSEGLEPDAPVGGGRLYRTGDRVRWRSDGELEFLGRLDHQVKVRGFRVELGDVEVALRQQPQVAEAAALVLGEGPAARLVAAVALEAEGEETQGKEITGEALRQAVGERLPAYLTPTRVMVEGSLPRLPNGKLDRRTLARRAADWEGHDEVMGGVPVSEVERRLVAVWVEVLGLGVDTAATGPQSERESEPAESPGGATVGLAVGLESDFFALGGHSLSAVRLASRIAESFGVEMAVGEVFDAPTLAAQAQRLEELLAQGSASSPDGKSLASAPPPVPRDPQAPPTLSYAQRRLWLLTRLDPLSPLYNISGALDLDGAFEPQRLAAAARALVRRHEPLAVSVVEEAGEPAPRWSPQALPELPVVDLSGLPRERREPALVSLSTAEARRPLSAAAAPLLRLLLLRVEPRRHRAVVTLHHLAADGWAVEIFLAELARSYAGETLVELPVRYRDYARWQRDWLESAQDGQTSLLESQLGVWESRLQGLAPQLSLPVDHPRPARRSGRGAALEMRLDASLAAAVTALAAQLRVTPFTVLLGAWATLLARFGAGGDVPVGTPVANRRRPELEGLVGLFVNTLVLRCALRRRDSFADLLARLRAVVLEAQEHQDVPFDRVVERLQPERSLASTPLFQVMFAYLNVAPTPRALPGLEARPVQLFTGAAEVDLFLGLREQEDGALGGQLAWATDLFEATTGARLASAFRQLLTGAVANPERALDQLPLLTAPQRGQLLSSWSGAEVTAPRTTGPSGEPIYPRLDHLLAAAAEAHPDAVSVVDAAGQLTYRELGQRAAAVAAALRNAGVGAGDAVAVMLPRDQDLVAALWGVHAAGAAYVPLDPGYPSSRLAFTVADSGARRLLLGRAMEEPLADLQQALHQDTELQQQEEQKQQKERDSVPLEVLKLEPLIQDAALSAASSSQDSAPRGAGDPEGRHLAYWIYTSGSTGRPKGVAIEHRRAAALVAWARGTFGEALGATLAATSICFDLSVFELFAPLASGGTVVMAQDALDLAAMAQRHPVRLLNTVPSAAAALVAADGELPASVEVVALAGEPLRRALVDRLYERSRARQVWNLYGPSEDTTYSTESLVPRGVAAEPDIGRPLPGTQAYVVDAALRWTPPGVRGELLLGGAGLARGYGDRPALTADRFVPDPFSSRPGARLYRTGDRARFASDGRLELQGRLDHQVKVRGFRIEPGEVESALLALPRVREAVVEARPVDLSAAGELQLVAWVAVGEESPLPESAALRRHLGEGLPTHMVPSALRVLEELPHLPNGKVDRRRLPDPWEGAGASAASATGSSGGSSGSPAPALSGLQGELATLWAEVLGRAAVGLEEDFFELGGHSLLAVRLLARIRETMGVELELADLFEAPSVAALASTVEARLEISSDSAGALAGSPSPRPATAGEDPQPGVAAATAPLSFAQQGIWLVETLAGGAGAYNIPGALDLVGELRPGALESALGGVVQRHDGLRTAVEVEAGAPRQRILSSQELRQRSAGAESWPLPAVVDLSGLDSATVDLTAVESSLGARLAALPMDLTTPPLLRAVLVRHRPAAHRLLLSLHHIVSDAASLDLLGRELATLYDHALVPGSSRGDGPVEDAGALAPPPALNYLDYALWQRRWLRSEAARHQRAFWKRYLASEPQRALVPLAEEQSPGAGDDRAVRCTEDLPSSWVAEAERLAAASGVTLFALTLAGFLLFLRRLTGQQRPLLGVAVDGRHRAGTEEVVGCFINMLPLAAAVPREGESPRQLAQRLGQETVELLQHRDLPSEEILAQLPGGAPTAADPALRIAFGVQQAPPRAPRMAGLETRLEAVEEERARFPLTLWLVHGQGEADSGAPAHEGGEVNSLTSRVTARWTASTRYCEAGRLAALHRLYAEALQRIVSAPDSPLAISDLTSSGPAAPSLPSKAERWRRRRPRRTLRKPASDD